MNLYADKFYSEDELLIVTTSSSNLPFQFFSNSSFYLEEFKNMDNQYSWAGFFTLVRADKDSRKIFILLIINFAFTFVEFFYGLLGNSLSLISDSAHMLFDSTALAIGLYASFMSKLKPDGSYTYGYKKNLFCLFLFFCPNFSILFLCIVCPFTELN